MSDKKTPPNSSPSRREFLQKAAFLTAATLPVLAGCGSGGGQDGQGGRVRVVVEWPERTPSASRYIPPYAESLYFELYLEQDPQQRYQLVLDRPAERPSQQSAVFDVLLSAGSYVLAGVARTQKGGQGETVASALTPVQVLPNQTATASLTLNSTIARITVPNQRLRLTYPGSAQILGQALDPDGKTVFVPSTYLKGTVVSGQDVVEFDAVGNLISKRGEGQAVVRLTEEGAGIVSEPISVETLTEKAPGIIWVSTNEQQLGTVNVATGTYTTVGYHVDQNANLKTMSDIAWQPGANPRLWGVSGSDLYTISPTDGTLTLVARVRENGVSVSGINGLDFRLDGTLFASTSANRLYTINLTTGAATRIGTMGASSAGDIAFDINDNLFLSATGDSLYRVSTTDATVTSLGSFSPYRIFGMAFTTGILYGFSATVVNGELSIVRLNTLTGAATRVGAIPAEVFGQVNGASFGPR